MTGDSKERGARPSIRLHLIVGLAVVVVLAGGLGGWASTAEISGALIAPGAIVVESNVKKVQHPTGGVVGEVLAKDGDLVKAGDVVVRLDDTVTKASLAIVNKNLYGLWARGARLEAEQQGLDKIVFPRSLLERADDPDAKNVMVSESKLFEVRTTGRTGQKAQLRERITQLNEEIAGLTAQERAKDQEIALVQKELAGVRDLYDKHLVQISRLTTLERDTARLNGERAQFIASKAQAKGKITETELQIIQIDKDLVSDVSKDLRETNDKIGEFVERKVTAEDQLRRTDIRAPQNGMVLQSTVHTVGGVITAGDAIMMIVPQADDLQVEAKVNPQDIDKLQIGQKTLLAAFGLQPAHHAGTERGGHPCLARRHHRPAHRTILLHDPGFDAVRRDRAARRGQTDSRHAGGSLRADRRPHHDVLSDQAAERSVDAGVPREVTPSSGRSVYAKASYAKASPGHTAVLLIRIGPPREMNPCSFRTSPHPGYGRAVGTSEKCPFFDIPGFSQGSSQGSSKGLPRGSPFMGSR